jgi:predicted O-methyltransferase YrrM
VACILVYFQGAAMSRKTLNLTDRLYQYILSVSLRESQEQLDLRNETQKLSAGNMQIAPEQAQFMQWLVTLIQAKTILEIGTFTGYSALSMALALPENGKIVCCDISDEWTPMAEDFWRKADVLEKIDHRIAPAVDTLEALLAEGKENKFDLVFIDADKQAYPDYYEKSLSLVRVGGVILIDNVFQDGDVADPECQKERVNVIRKLNAFIHHDPRVTLSMLPISDGLTMVIRK